MDVRPIFLNLCPSLKIFSCPDLTRSLDRWDRMGSRFLCRGLKVEFGPSTLTLFLRRLNFLSLGCFGDFLCFLLSIIIFVLGVVVVGVVLDNLFDKMSRILLYTMSS